MPHFIHCKLSTNGTVRKSQRILTAKQASRRQLAPSLPQRDDCSVRKALTLKTLKSAQITKPQQTNKWVQQLRNGFNFWTVLGIMNTSGLLQTLQENRFIHDSMNRSKMNSLLIFTFYYKYLKYNKLFLI